MARAGGRIDILGVGVDPLSVEELHERLRRGVRGRERAVFLNVNAHCLNLVYRDSSLRDYFNRAEVVFCDGAGVMLAARMLGGEILGRITYADWLPALADFAEAEDFSMYFLGARPGTAWKTADRLRASNPGLRIVGSHHGYFDPLDNAENEAVVEDIRRADPDILLVGMGMPRQEHWLMRNRDKLGARVALTGGAVFDYASGELRRGPSLLTDNGFEWLARLSIEPKRLWRRYLLGNPLFFLRVLGQALRERISGLSPNK